VAGVLNRPVRLAIPLPSRPIGTRRTASTDRRSRSGASWRREGGGQDVTEGLELGVRRRIADGLRGVGYHRLGGTGAPVPSASSMEPELGHGPRSHRDLHQSALSRGGPPLRRDVPDQVPGRDRAVDGSAVTRGPDLNPRPGVRNRATPLRPKHRARLVQDPAAGGRRADERGRVAVVVRASSGPTAAQGNGVAQLPRSAFTDIMAGETARHQQQQRRPLARFRKAKCGGSGM